MQIVVVLVNLISILYPGFDPDNQYIGVDTPLDKLYHQQSGTSDNPMDINWGGVKFTKQSVASGKYDEDEVKIQVA